MTLNERKVRTHCIESSWLQPTRGGITSCEYGTSPTRIHTWEMLESERAAHCWFHHDTQTMYVTLATGFVSQGSYTDMGLSFMFRSWVESLPCMSIVDAWPFTYTDLKFSASMLYFCCPWLSSLLTQPRSRLPCVLLFDLSLLQVSDFHSDTIYSHRSSLALSQCTPFWAG